MAARKALSVAAVAGATALALSACGGGGDGSDQGLLTVGVTDAPIDGATRVIVQFRGIEIKHESEEPRTITFATPRQIDLLEQQEGRTAILIEDEPMTAGAFQWLRLIVDADPNVAGDSYIDFANGQRCELRIPSGSESGLKLNRGFTLPADGNLAVTVDFDLRRSIHAPPGQNIDQVSCDSGQIFMMRPTLRLVDNAEVGAIAGIVDPQVIADVCPANENGAVYIFSVPSGQAAATVDDVDGTGDPLTSALVRLNSSSFHSYRAAFIPAGQYTVAYTCDAVTDAPDVDGDEVTFIPTAGKTVGVQNNLVTTVDFTVEDLPAAE